jgi:hypothetical protein
LSDLDVCITLSLALGFIPERFSNDPVTACPPGPRGVFLLAGMVRRLTLISLDSRPAAIHSWRPAHFERPAALARNEEFFAGALGRVAN